MSLTKYQQPYTQGHYVIGSVYPEYYTTDSTEYTESKFKYKFTINDVNGVVATTNVPPSPTGGLGIFSPVSILKNKLSFKFQPEITTFTKATGGILQYRVDLAEQGITSPASTTFSKNIMINCAREDFTLENHILSGDTKRFLTDWSSTRKVTVNDRGTSRILSGFMRPGIDEPYDSWARSIVLEITKENGDLYYMHSEYGSSPTINPYYAQTNSNVLESSDAVLEDVSAYLLDIPTGPYNLNQITFRLKAWTENGGVYEELQNTAVFNDLSPSLFVGDKYTVQTYAWPKGSNGRTSAKEYYEVVSDCDTTSCQLAWENELGGTDYYTATKYKTKNIRANKSSYQKVRDTQGGLSGLGNEHIGHDQYAGGETIFDSTKTIEYDIYTDWVTETEIQDLENLWTSKNVYLRLEDTWYPVIILNDMQEIDSDRSGLRNYLIQLRFSNKKYR